MTLEEIKKFTKMVLLHENVSEVTLEDDESVEVVTRLESMPEAIALYFEEDIAECNAETAEDLFLNLFGIDLDNLNERARENDWEELLLWV